MLKVSKIEKVSLIRERIKLKMKIPEQQQIIFLNGNMIPYEAEVIQL